MNLKFPFSASWNNSAHLSEPRIDVPGITPVSPGRPPCRQCQCGGLYKLGDQQISTPANEALDANGDCSPTNRYIE